MKVLKPTSPGRRGTVLSDYSSLTKKRPEKKLVFGKRASGGRNNLGRITSRSRGGGSKRLLRDVEFGQLKKDIPGVVSALEYDPNRTAFIALVVYADGDKKYILAPQGLKIGSKVLVKEKTPLRSGNRMALKNIPVGMEIHNVELFPGKRGQIIRSAGSSGRILSHDGDFVSVLLPSREIRKISGNAYASLGAVSNADWSSVKWGKAGRSRWAGQRPHVRGSAMNPVDHPHGGGEGRTGIGLKHPKTLWGKPALGVKTRKKYKLSNKFIVQRRKSRR